MAPKRSAKQRLRALREEHGISAEKLGLQVGCSGSALLRYEADDPRVARVPRLHIAARLFAVTEALGDGISPLDWCG